jgi:hypothetical protein
LFIEGSSPIETGFKAILESTLFLPTPSYGICLDFWYHMYGTGIGSLNVYLNISNASSLIWTQNGNKGNMWKNAQVTIISAKYFRINIEAIRGNSIYSDIAIDDLDFMEKSCTLSPADANPSNQITIPIITTTRSLRPTSLYDCTFETGYCIWSPSPESTFNWTRAQGLGGSQIAGPIDYDHTLGISDGWYIFTSIANKRQTDISRIEGSLSSTRCMEFYYYFSTNGKYKFSIYVKVGNQLGLPIWSRSSSQGNFWRLGRVTVNSASTYKIVMEVSNVVNGGLEDKIAIDDVYFTLGACQDSSDVNKLCTFSSDTCGYTIDTKSNFQWSLFLPETRLLDFNSENENEFLSKVNPIPIYDHTTDGVGSGYIYVDTRGFRPNETATLTSKLYAPFSTDNPTEASRCVEFYFYIQGTNVVRLNLKTNAPPSTTKNTIWSRDYDHSSYWWKGEANIKLITNYTTIFEAVILNNTAMNGLAALDDIIIRNGQCSR